MNDSLELIALENDQALIFKKQSLQEPISEDPLDMRCVKYLQLTIRQLKLNKQFDNISLVCQIPMSRGAVIEYQQHTIYDSERNAKIHYFNSQIKTNLQITEALLPQISSSIIQFRVFSDVELGIGEFRLQTMLLDGLRHFEYTIPIQAQIQKKIKQKQLQMQTVEIGSLTFVIQLQDGSEQKREMSPIKREIDIEEHIDRLRAQILNDIQKEKQLKQQKKQEIEERRMEDLIRQLQSFQLYLSISKMHNLNRQLCINKLDSEQINLFLKLKVYGTQDICQTETYWNVYNQLQINYEQHVPISIESIDKMSRLPWIIELWGKSMRTELLLGVCRLNLCIVNSSVLTHNSQSSLSFLKTNLLPLMVYDQDIGFEDIKGQELVGMFRIKLAFGTVPQIQKIQQTLQPQEIEPIEDEEPEEPEQSATEPQMEEEKPNPDQTQKKWEQVPLKDCLIDVLNRVYSTMTVLPKEEYILVEEFEDIIRNISQAPDHVIRSLSLYLQVDEITLNWNIFLTSWQAFNNYKIILKEHYSKTYISLYKQVMRIFNGLNAFEKYIPRASFGLINIDTLRQTLLEIKGSNSPSGPSLSAITVNAVIDTLICNGHQEVQINQLLDYLRQVELHQETVNIQVPMKEVCQLVQKNLQIWAQNVDLQELLLEREYIDQLKPSTLIGLFEQFNYKVTLLDAICILNLVSEFIQIEEVDSLNTCSEFAFWKYIEYLQQNDIIKSPRSPIQESSPQKEIQPMTQGRKIPINVHQQHILYQIEIKILEIKPTDISKFAIAIQLEGTNIQAISPEINTSKLNLKCVIKLCELYNKDPIQMINERLRESMLKINFVKQDHMQIFAEGNLAIEELLNESEAFISIYDVIHLQEISLVHCEIQIKQKIIDEPIDEMAQFEWCGDNAPVQQFDQNIILQKLKPEVLHSFKIHLQNINWYKQTNHQNIIIQVSLATDKKVLKQAIPHFRSDELTTNNPDIEILYDVKCDQILATQIAKCYLQLQLILTSQTQTQNLYSYIPLQPVFENEATEGEIPMDNDQGQFVCTLSVAVSHYTDKIVHKQINLINKELSRKIVIRPLELILFDQENELGEIYYMLINPVHQSESYPVRSQTSQILTTHDSIFIIEDNDLTTNTVELNVRSIFLGEDKLIGSVLLELNEMHSEGIYADANYLTLDHRQSEFQLQARLGVKIIYICTESITTNYMQVFTYPNINDVKSQDLQNYLRANLKLSFSEIQFFTQLIKNDIFSTEILPAPKIETDINILCDLLREFRFFDQYNKGFVNPDKLAQIFRYFGIEISSVTEFIPKTSSRKPIDYEAQTSKFYEYFDYITFLAKLQQSNQNVKKIFHENTQGPMQHQLDIIKSLTPIKKKSTIFNFQIESGHNLNQLHSNKRLPNTIITFPQLQLESPVFYSQNNPKFNSLISIDSKFESLHIVILDKRYNTESKAIYETVQIADVRLNFSEFENVKFPHQIKLPLGSGSPQPYLKIQIWTDKEEKSAGKTMQTVRRFVDALDKENDSGEQNADDQNIETLKNDLDEIIKQMKQTKPVVQNKEQVIKQVKPIPPPKEDEQKKTDQLNRKLNFYQSSSESSSNPTKNVKSVSSGLEKIKEEIPYADEQLKRIEKILRQNNLESDSDDD